MWKTEAYHTTSSKILNRFLNVIDEVKQDSVVKANELWGKISYGTPPYKWNWNIVFSDKNKTKEYPLKHYVLERKPYKNNEPVLVDLPEKIDWIDTCDTKHDQKTNIIMSNILGGIQPKK